MALIRHFLLLVSISLLGAEGSRIITLKNRCNTIIWPGFLDDTITRRNTDPWRQLVDTSELASHNFQLEPGESINMTTLEEDWFGMIWGRSGCLFDNFGNGTCDTGDCNGKLQCPRFIGVPIPPYTMAYINTSNNIDSCYVNLQDGFNFPMSISPYGRNYLSHCPDSSCLWDINSTCPSDQKRRILDEIVGCENDCSADFYNANSIYCCNGRDGHCKASNFSTAVNKACPTAVVNGYNLEAASTFRCTGANYLVSFC